MSKLFIAFSCIAATLLFSCQKDTITSPVQNTMMQQDIVAGIPGASPSPVFGLMPVKVHGYLPTRDNIAINIWSSMEWAYTKNIVYDSVFSLNINHHGIASEPVPYTTDIEKYKDTLRDIISSIQHPAFYTQENEEQHFNDGIYHSEGITAYCNQLKAGAEVFESNQLFTNGGFTLPVYYWYYSKTHDEDFKLKVIPNVNIRGVQNKIDSTEYEMNVIRSMPANFVNNIHIYLTDTSQAQPIIRMCNYIKQYTGHSILSNEAGIYKSDVALIGSLVSIARSTSMPYMIFYNGDGRSAALPITIAQIEAAK